MEKTSSVAKENLSAHEGADGAGGFLASRQAAFIALVAGNVALAFGALLVRFSDTGPVATGFWRLALAAPILLLLARHFKQPVGGLPRKTLLMVMLGGLFFAADIAAWHTGIMMTKLANATLFGNFASLLLVVYGLILARQKPSLQTSIAILLAFGGALLLMGQSYEASREHLVGDMLSLLAGVLYTGYVLALQRARSSMGSWAVLAISTIASAFPLLLFAMAMGEQIIPTDWTPLILLALTSQIVGQGLLIYSLPHFSPLVIGLTLLVQPSIAALSGYLIFQESIGPIEILGMILVAVALVLVRGPQKA